MIVLMENIDKQCIKQSIESLFG